MNETVFFEDSTTTAGVVYFCETRRTDGALTQATECWSIYARRTSDNKIAFANGKTTFTLKASLRASYTYTFV